LDFGVWDFLIKKGAHMVGYAGLAVAAYIATGRYWLAWVIAVLYAMTDEYHQLFVPGRNGTAVDVVIDGVGAAIGLCVLWWLRRRIQPPLGVG
jgi:VanZ family protein